MAWLSLVLLCGPVSAALALGLTAQGPKLLGYLPPDEGIGIFKAESSCLCSQLCFTRPECASVSFFSENATCRLFRRVASWRTLLPHPHRHYRFLRGRSGHHQFCAADSDCVQPDDRCLGKICHAEEHLTCRTLQHVHGINETGRYWGAVGGLTVPLYCNMEYQGGGWTLLAAGGGAVWNASSALWRPADAGSPSLSKPYSIYKYADAIARAPLVSTEDFFEIDMYDVVSVTGGTWRVPRSKSLLRTAPGTTMLNLFNGRMYGGWKRIKLSTVVPWLASEKAPDTFISVSPLPNRKPPEGVVLGARPGVQRWGGGAYSGHVAILIRE